jgi:hypothetical protein
VVRRAGEVLEKHGLDADLGIVPWIMRLDYLIATALGGDAMPLSKWRGADTIMNSRIRSKPLASSGIGKKDISCSDGVSHDIHHWQGGPRMRHSNRGRFRQQVQFLRRQFLQNGDLPFTDILTEKVVAQEVASVRRSDTILRRMNG